MEAAHLKELMTLESSYWWHVAKRQLATSLLLSHTPPVASIVEGGIGAGGNLLHWKSLGYDVQGLDIMDESVDYARQRGLNRVFQHDLHDRWPMEERSANAIVLLDVLEHLRDPVLALRQAAQVLDQDGRIIFTVPAHPWLYSEWDERLGHYRRYTPQSLRGHVEQAGLRLIQMRPWNTISLPIAMMLRTYRRMFPRHAGAEFPRIGRLANRCLVQIQEWERRVALRWNPPFGLSIVGVIAK